MSFFKDWQYKLLKFCSSLICMLPYRVVLALGKGLGCLYYRIAGRQRRRALEQMQECLHISAAQAEPIIRSLFTKLGQTFIEVMYMPALNAGNISKYVTIENRQHLVEALKQGKGVVFLTAHIGNWEWLGASLSMDGFPMTTVIKRQPNEQYTRILNEYRQMVGLEIFSSGSTELVSAAKALKKGKVLGFLSDQDGGRDGLFIEFLGKMASTPKGAAIFAKRFGSPVVPSFIVRRPEGGHRVIIGEPLYYQDTGNEEKDVTDLTLRMTRTIEAAIKEYPDEWLWFQRRWNTKYEQVRTTTTHSAGGAV